nr:MAG TPA: hypothetical protein [Caudoviricetes sp.]
MTVYRGYSYIFVSIKNTHYNKRVTVIGCSYFLRMHERS